MCFQVRKPFIYAALGAACVLLLTSCGRASGTSPSAAERPSVPAEPAAVEVQTAPAEAAAPEAQTIPAEPAAPAEQITQEQAREIALSHAGLAEASFYRTELEWEDGRQVYEVEFWADGTEYDYEIDAVTGEIRSYDYDIERFSPPESGAETLIGEDEARDIALRDSGVSEHQAQRLQIRLERDDGRQIYEVEFRVGQTEYDYDIDALTGEIRSRDVDRD